MKIAPIDIVHKNFGRKMMGLDPEEVSEFLQMVADEYEAVILDRNNMREQNREKELSIAEFKDRDDLLKSTITTATKMADRIHVDAEREAKLILNDANQKADMIVRDARDSLKKIYQEITDLKRIRMQFENNMRALFQSHVTMLDQGQKYMPNPMIEPKAGIEDEILETSPTSAAVPGDEDAAIRSNVNQAIARDI